MNDAPSPAEPGYDLDRAAAFMTTHARLLDRCRFDLVLGRRGPESALRALDAYRNPDGGYGWALEPDLRTPESQPVGALHAFEVFHEAGPAANIPAGALCDWLDTATLPDGGLPFALPMSDPAGTAPWWAGADPKRSSLHLTAAVTAAAHQAARHAPAVRDHPWLARATGYCLREIAARFTDGPGHPMEFRYSLWLLDAVHDIRPEAPGELARLGAHIPSSGRLPVPGGAPDEAMNPLDLSPAPGRPLRRYVPSRAIDDELARLAAAQEADGGWSPDWNSVSPAGRLEWRGWATVRAVTLLRAAVSGG